MGCRGVAVMIVVAVVVVVSGVLLLIVSTRTSSLLPVSGGRLEFVDEFACFLQRQFLDAVDPEALVGELLGIAILSLADRAYRAQLRVCGVAHAAAADMVAAVRRAVGSRAILRRRAKRCGCVAGINLTRGEFVVDRLTGEIEQVADLRAERVRIADQIAVEFQLDVDGSSAASEVRLADLAAEACVEFEHRTFSP